MSTICESFRRLGYLDNEITYENICSNMNTVNNDQKIELVKELANPILDCREHEMAAKLIIYYLI